MAEEEAEPPVFARHEESIIRDVDTVNDNRGLSERFAEETPYVVADDTPVSPDLEVELEQTRQINIQKKQYISVPGSTPYKPQDFDEGPNTYGNRYSTLRNYFFVGYDDKNIVVW